MTIDELQRRLAGFPRALAGHLPTPVEPLPRLGAALDVELSVKRDDCTGVGFGGNKVRQLEYYLGAALARHADTIVITGAVQSNFVRTAAAMAARFGTACHIQLEERVPDVSLQYRSNGNVLLDRLLGAHLHPYPDGEDEAGADRAVRAIAAALARQGRAPYVIPLGIDSPPLGALGYVGAAIELLQQLETSARRIDMIVVASGSALTHAGLVLGLRLLGSAIEVHGVCVRRDGRAQRERVKKRIADTAALLGVAADIGDADLRVTDAVLAPGYGRLNAPTADAIRRTAQSEGLFLDPVYTGKAMAGLIAMAGRLRGRRVLFWHTGGQPALFAYADRLL